MRTKFYSFLLISVLFTASPYSGISAQSDIKKFFQVGGDVYTAPFHFDKSDWTNVALTAGLTGAGFILDKPVNRFFLGNQNDVADVIFSIDKYFFEEAVIAVVGIYGYGAIAKDNEIRNLGLQLAEASTFAVSIQVLTKIIAGRKRPDAGYGNSSFSPFTLDVEGASFPSGHTTLAFAFSSVMANYTDNTTMKIVWYSFASLMGMARMYHNRHWFSDVILGAAIGYFVGDFVSHHKTNNEIKIPPPGEPSQKLLSFNFEF